MAVRIDSAQAQTLSAIADLHESVIGGFWQDLVSLAHWDDEVAEDELGMELFELAEASGLRWPTHVPHVAWTRKGRKLDLMCSPGQAEQMLRLYVDVCAGRWRTVADVAQMNTPGELDPALRSHLSKLQRRAQITEDHRQAAVVAREVLDQLRQIA